MKEIVLTNEELIATLDYIQERENCASTEDTIDALVQNYLLTNNIFKKDKED